MTLSDISVEGELDGPLGGKYELTFFPLEDPNKVHIASEIYAYGVEDVSVTVPIEALEEFLAKVREEMKRANEGGDAVSPTS